VKRSPLVRRTPLKARAPLAAGKALARGTARLKARRRPAVGTVEQREKFKLWVCHPLAVCAVTDDGPCDGPLEAHHVVSQQWLRKQCATKPDQLAWLLWHTANGMPLCERHHRRHTNAVRRVPLSALNVKHCWFIDLVGADLFVERTYRKAEA